MKGFLNSACYDEVGERRVDDRSDRFNEAAYLVDDLSGRGLRIEDPFEISGGTTVDLEQGTLQIEKEESQLPRGRNDTCPRALFALY